MTPSFHNKKPSEVIVVIEASAMVVQTGRKGRARRSLARERTVLERHCVIRLW